jgi:hypothetical protein
MEPQNFHDAMDAVTEVLNALVMQLIDMNTTLAELHSRLLVQRSYMQGIVDELRTLNGAVGRLEDAISYRP